MKKTMYSPAKGKETKKLKGFTLVELIVVMVILALLMALAIPQVTKYIDKAGEITMKSEARACYTAVQAFCVEKYEADRSQGDALTKAVVWDLDGVNSTSFPNTKYNIRTGSVIWEMANIPDNGRITSITIEGTTVKKMVYGYPGESSTTVTYENGKYTVNK